MTDDRAIGGLKELLGCEFDEFGVLSGLLWAQQKYEPLERLRNIAELTVHLASSMGIGEEDLVPIRHGALTHDIGMIGLPDFVKSKPGPLAPEERFMVEQHPVFSRMLISPLPELKDALDIPYCHHERWDGSGYPRGLKGEAIPLSARIFAVVDVWTALRTNRPDRNAWTDTDALDHILRFAGSHFDPNVIAVFLDRGLS